MNFVPLPRGRWPGEHQFYFGMALALLAAVVLGFARSFFLRPLFPDHPSPPETVFYWHGAVFTAWFVLFSVQPYLIASGRVVAHRALGRGGAVLAAVMVVFGCYVAVVAAARPDGFIGLPIPPFNFLIVPLVDMTIFGLLTGIAVAKRNVAQTHKRLMLIASITIVVAAIARWPFDFIRNGGPLAFFGVQDLFLLALACWDLASRRRLHIATVLGGLLLIVSQPLRLVASGSEGWLRFAAWLTGLVS
jgi:hypothetical protein